jgi:hypothetical protein
VERLPVVEHPSLEPGFFGLQMAVSPAGDGQPATAPVYRELSARDCQCVAAAAAPKANALDYDRQVIQTREDVARRLFPCHENELAQVQKAILWYNALDARNLASATALEAFYHLAEAEAQRDLLAQSLILLDDTLAKTEDQVKQGLQARADYEILHRQRLDLQAEQAQLDLTVHNLNSTLRVDLGLDPHSGDWRIWPGIDFQEVVEPVDPEAAITEALTHRPQLAALRTMQDKLDVKTLPAARALLRAVNGLPGMADAQPARLPALLLLAMGKRAGDKAEVEIRHQQLSQTLAEREHAIAEEVRQAARATGAEWDLVSLARDKANSLRDKVRDAEDQLKKGLGQASFAKVNEAKIEWLRARSAVVKEVTAWQIARVQLKLAEGVLVLECGSPPDISYCPAEGIGRPQLHDRLPEGFPGSPCRSDRPAEGEAHPGAGEPSGVGSPPGLVGGGAPGAEPSAGVARSLP